MKIPKQACTTEFKELAVKRIKDGQSVGKVVTPEEMELSRLRAENLRLKRELEIIKKSGGVLCKGCSVKYAWIAEQGNAFALAEMCGVLEVGISGYRAWKRGGKPDRKRLSDSQMLALSVPFMPNSKAPTAARAWSASCG